MSEKFYSDTKSYTEPESSASKYSHPASVWVGKIEYPIDSETAKRLREGDIPSALKSRITTEQGSEFCFDFCRQRRLMKRILDQIEEGKQPEHLRSLIEGGTVPSEILYKLYHHHLIVKAELSYKETLQATMRKRTFPTSVPEDRCFSGDKNVAVYAMIDSDDTYMLKAQIHELSAYAAAHPDFAGGFMPSSA